MHAILPIVFLRNQRLNRTDRTQSSQSVRRGTCNLRARIIRIRTNLRSVCVHLREANSANQTGHARRFPPGINGIARGVAGLAARTRRGDLQQDGIGKFALRRIVRGGKFDKIVSVSGVAAFMNERVAKTFRKGAFIRVRFDGFARMIIPRKKCGKGFHGLFRLIGSVVQSLESVSPQSTHSACWSNVTPSRKASNFGDVRYRPLAAMSMTTERSAGFCCAI